MNAAIVIWEHRGSSLVGMNQTLAYTYKNFDSFSGKSKGRSQGFYYLYVEAVSIKNSKSLSVTEDLEDSNSDARPKELVDLFSFSPRALEFIVKFSEEHGSDVFRQILQSICPSIYGHELVKGKPLICTRLKLN